MFLVMMFLGGKFFIVVFTSNCYGSCEDTQEQKKQSTSSNITA